MTAQSAPAAVLFVITSSDLGGAETVLLETVRRLDRSQFAPAVCTLREPGRVAREISRLGVSVTSLGMSEQVRIRELLSGAFRLAREIDRLGVRIVHSSLYRANVLARIAGRLSRQRPAIVSGHHSLRPLHGWFPTVASRWTARFSDRIVVVSMSVAEALRQSERLPAERVVVIPNGVDTTRFRPQERETTNRRMEPGANDCVVGYVGRLSKEKGLDDLLVGVAMVRRRGVAVRLLLAGQGPERDALAARARELGIESWVHFEGPVDDPVRIYAASDVFVLPSHEEGAPLAVLEAMACGCPVVATTVGGVPELVDHEQTGLLVAPGAPEELAAALTRLADDPALRGRLGRAARGRILKDLDIGKTVDRHARLYRELLGGTYGGT